MKNALEPPQNALDYLKNVSESVKMGWNLERMLRILEEYVWSISKKCFGIRFFKGRQYLKGALDYLKNVLTSLENALETMEELFGILEKCSGIWNT